MRLQLVPRSCRLLMMAGYVLIYGGIALMMIRFPTLLLLAAGGLLWRRLSRRRAVSDAYGSARLADYADLSRGGLLAQTGLILGRASLMPPPARLRAVRGLFDPSLGTVTACRQMAAAFAGKKRGPDDLIRVNHFVHLATFAPAGKGKSVCVLVPNLRSYTGNCVITDPKGELFRLTAGHRHRKFGHAIIHLNPFHIEGGGSDSFNPLDYIDERSPKFLDACRNLSSLLVVRLGTEKEPHWNDSAEIILTAFIAFVCACEIDRGRRNLLTVRALLSSRQGYLNAIATMRQVEGFGDVVARLGDSLGWFQEEELNGLMTTVLRHTQWLDSPLIAKHTATSSFDPNRLRSGERMTVYLSLPHSMLTTLAPLQRMWIGSILRIITEDRVDERNPVLFLIDEAAHLGKCQPLEDAVTLMRGMGIRLWFFFQSLNQMKTCYGEAAEVLLENIGTQQYFGTNSYQTAEAVSKRIGDETRSISSRDNGTSTSRPVGGKFGEAKDAGSTSRSSSVSRSEIARAVLKPEELMVLPGDIALVFHDNLPVIPSRLLRYYDAPEFRRGGSARTNGLGLAGLVQAASVLLMGVLAMAAGAFAVSLPRSAPDGFGVRPALSLPSLGSFSLPELPFRVTPQRIEADRRAAIRAAMQLAAEREVDGEYLERKRLAVPARLTKKVIRSELQASIARANERADRRLEELGNTAAIK